MAFGRHDKHFASELNGRRRRCDWSSRQPLLRLLWLAWCPLRHRRGTASRAAL